MNQVRQGVNGGKQCRLTLTSRCIGAPNVRTHFPMNPPPRPPTVTIPEVLPREDPGHGPDPQPSPPPGRTAFHPASALALVAVDNLWMLPDFAGPELWLLTIPLSFLTVFLAVYFIQRHRNGDRRRSALWKGILLGAVAAVPTSITGTPVGLALLAWAGLRHPWKK